MKVRTSWGMTNSNFVLEQEITVDSDSFVGLINELDSELFKDYPIDTPTVFRDYYIERFSNPELLQFLYDELVIYLGELDYFDLVIPNELKIHLNQEQMDYNKRGDDYLYGLVLFDRLGNTTS
jgi:hypothetical protein